MVTWSESREAIFDEPLAEALPHLESGVEKGRGKRFRGHAVACCMLTWFWQSAPVIQNETRNITTWGGKGGTRGGKPSYDSALR